MTELAPVPDGALALPNGGWAVIRDHSTLTHGDREDFLESLPDVEALSPVKGGLATFAALISYAVTDWSYGTLPSEDPTVLRALPIVVYDALRDAVEPLQQAIFPTMDKPTEDKTSPTGPSNA